MIVGYLSATFDCLHTNHRRLLRRCKKRCDFLIIGLVTDELAIKQKRKPLMPYDERYDALISMENIVDEVVPFFKQSRIDIKRRLKVDIFFTVLVVPLLQVVLASDSPGDKKGKTPDDQMNEPRDEQIEL